MGEHRCRRLRATINAAIDGGINFIDTADVYSAGESEEIVGRALKGRRDEVILATKVHGEMGPGRNDRGNSRVWIAKEVENSLRRLGTDHIDLYQIHRPEGETDVEETLGALTDLQRQGKIRYFGSSTYPGWQMVEAQWAAERRGLSRFRTEQPPYSIFVRHIEHDVLPVAQRYGMGVLVWSPLCRGWLTGRYRREEFDRSPDSRAVRGAQRADWLAAALRRVASGGAAQVRHRRGADPARGQGGHHAHAHGDRLHARPPGVTSTIIGPRTREQLDDLLGAADVRLDAATLDGIDELVPPGTLVDEEDRGFDPWWFEPEARRR